MDPFSITLFANLETIVHTDGSKQVGVELDEGSQNFETRASHSSSRF